MKYEPARRGLMLVMSSPSGAGKTTLTRRLLEEDSDISMSVSATTRPPRPGEIDGKDYYFVSHDEFRQMVQDGQMLEHATVFDNFYGTPKSSVEKSLKAGKDVLFDIDWQGAQQLGQNTVRIFILPPSIPELRARLKKRAQDSDETIAKRMTEAQSEISHWAEYNYVLVNDDLDDTYEKLKTIIQAERLRLEHQAGISVFARSLMEDAKEIR